MVDVAIRDLMASQVFSPSHERASIYHSGPCRTENSASFCTGFMILLRLIQPTESTRQRKRSLVSPRHDLSSNGGMVAECSLIRGNTRE